MSKLKPSTETVRAVISLTIFYLFFGFCISIFLYRGGKEFFGDLPLVHLFIRDQHITNFALSGLLMLCGGSFLAALRKFKMLATLTFLLILLNVVVESGTSFANVPDALDILSGTFGTLAGLGALGLIMKFGTFEPRR
jgi:hypothetical protein